MKFADRMNDIEVSGVRKILDLAQNVKDPVDFSIGRPDFDIPQLLKDDAKYWIQERYNRYTVSRGDPVLIQKIHKYLRRKKMIFEDVITTVGVIFFEYVSKSLLKRFFLPKQLQNTPFVFNQG